MYAYYIYIYISIYLYVYVARGASCKTSSCVVPSPSRTISRTSDHTRTARTHITLRLYHIACTSIYSIHVIHMRVYIYIYTYTYIHTYMHTSTTLSSILYSRICPINIMFLERRTTRAGGDGRISLLVSLCQLPGLWELRDLLCLLPAWSLPPLFL